MADQDQQQAAPRGGPTHNAMNDPARRPTENVVGRFQDDPIETPDIHPLWQHPDPPEVETQPPVDPWFGFTLPGGVDFQQRPPLGPPMPSRMPNARHPVTGAPIWVPENEGQPLPPSWNAQVQPNGVHPITGAATFVADQPPTGWWQPNHRPPFPRSGTGLHYSYPYPTPASEGHPSRPFGQSADTLHPAAAAVPSTEE